MDRNIKKVYKVLQQNELRFTDSKFESIESYTFLLTLTLWCSCPIADLIVGVQTTARAPFVSLFQVLKAEEGERWNRGEGLLKRSS